LYGIQDIYLCLAFYLQANTFQVGYAGIEPATSAVWTLEDLLKGD